MEAQRVWRERMEAEPVRFLGRRARAAPRRGPDAGRARSSTRTPEGIAFVPNATTGVVDRPRLAPLPARRRAARRRTTSTTRRSTRSEPAAERDGATRRDRAGSRSRSHDPSEARRGATCTRSTPRTRLALVSHVTSPDRPGPAGRARSSASSTGGASTRSSTARTRPGMVAGRPRRARRRVLDRQRPQVAVRAEGLGRAPRPRRPAGPASARSSSRHGAQRRPRPTGRGSGSCSTGRAPPTRRPTSRCPPRSGTSAASTTTAGRAS